MRQDSVMQFALLLLALSAGHADARAQSAYTKPQAVMAVWDTITPAGNLLTPDALAAKTGWAQIPVGTTVAGFKGDAVISTVGSWRWRASRPQAWTFTPWAAAVRLGGQA